MTSKYKVFFRRVSSKGQDLEMQISADAIYRQQYLPQELKVIEEHAVSANKLRLPERPEMMKLIWMILNDQVDVIYAFDRSRLFRDFYESNYFISICRKKNVRLFFTSVGNGHQQSTNNTLIEGVLNIVGDVEGKNIARRTEEARKRYPSKKLGYVKENKQYKKAVDKEDLLTQFFIGLANLTSYIELDVLLQKFKRSLKTNTETLLRIASDPFYAGYDLSTGKNKLSHVAPYLTLAQFEELQKKESILSKYEESITTLREQNIYQPYCGICQKPMNFRFNIQEEEASYSCARKHPMVMITANDLSVIILHSLENIINKLDTEKLMKDSKLYFKTIKKPLESDIASLKRAKDNILKAIILENDDLHKWKEEPRFQELKKLEAEVEESLSKIEETEQLLLSNKNIIQLIKDYLESGTVLNPYFLASMLIQKMIVFENELYLDVSRFDYIQDIKKTFIYEEGVLL